MRHRCLLFIVAVGLTLSVSCQSKAPEGTEQEQEPAADAGRAAPAADATTQAPAGDAAAPEGGADGTAAANATLTADEARRVLEIDAPALGDAPAPTTDLVMDAAHTVTTDPGNIPRLKLELGDEKFDLPLKHTHVNAEISGYVARVEVTQTYENPFDSAIETVYVFPLPENSAVDAMRMEIDDRIVEATIKRRAEARETYEQAKAAGLTAALLEQERPNIFTQSVANIAPKSQIKVVIRYVQDLTYDAGEYEFVFPMVVGPRFIPGDATGDKGDGWAPDTTDVPDASRITPPIMGAGMRSGHDISIEITGHAGLPVSAVDVLTHNVAVEQKSDGGFQMMLAEKESIPNRDFVMRYKVAGIQPAVTMLAHRDNKDADGFGYFSLIVQPPDLPIDDVVGRREFIFVVDVSGSMGGKPLGLCKAAMRDVLKHIRPVDTFNIIRFESSDAKVFEASRPASQTNIRAALEFVDAMHAGGGTMLGSAVEEALGAAPQKDRNRYVVFMTDAQIGNETQILGMTETLLDAYEKSGQKARVFSFGAGSNPNRYLLEQISTVGGGVTVYATGRDDSDIAVERLFELVDKPVLEGLSIDWGGLEVDEVYPKRLPPLFASHPIILHGRYKKGGTGAVVVSGKVGSEPTELHFDASLPDVASDHGALGTLWGRAKINDLERDLWIEHTTETVEAITLLGLDHAIVTAYTSFVAVDTSVKVGDGEPRKVVQPGETPQGYAALAPGSTAGNYGLGMTGTGRGGGGSGMGGFGTAGRGGGGKGGRNYGKSVGSLSEKAIGKPKLKVGRPDVSGSMDKRTIRRVVNQHKREVRACYADVLADNKGLHGKITISWVIDSTGVVTSVTLKSTTMNNKDVENCLTKAIKTWRFPAPKGGGLVTVSHPFVFEVGK